MRSRCALVVLLAIFLAASPPALAINIVPVFNAADNETPAFDLFNGGIQDLFDYAETYYQDIFEDPGYTLTVNFWYEDLEGGFLGLFNPETTVGNRVTEANIRIDTRLDTGGAFRDWYIDATPASDGEFDLQKTLWGDAEFSEKSAFIASPQTPDAFEVGYRGSAIGGSGASGKYDMLSTVLHEVGHALGIHSGATHENDDADYDFNSDFLFGAAAAAKIDVKDGEPDPGHMLPGTLLMCGECGAANFRRRPSHADLFAMATSSGLDTIDVPRREFYGGGVFNNAAAWSGGRTPDTNDEAFMRDAGLVVMNANDSIGSFQLLQSELATGNHSLDVNGTLTVLSRFSNVKAKLVVGSGGSVSADDVEIARNGEIDLVGSTLSVLGDLNFPPREFGGEMNGVLSGSGTVIVGGSLSNRGTIKPDGGTLTVTAGSFDLDGASGGLGTRRVDATTGSAVFNGPHSDAFKGTMDVGFTRLVTFNNSWTLDPLGDVNITDGGLINNAAWQADGTVVIDHTVPFGVVGVGGTGSMTLGPTGQLTTSGIVDFLGPTQIAGSMAVSSAMARLSGGGSFADTAQVSLAAGTELQLILDETYSIADDATFNGPGTIANGALATLVVQSTADIAAPLVNNGRLEIGTSPGRLDMSASFSQSATGTLEIEIGGPIAGKNFDLLDAAGHTATLAGTLELATINGFVPQAGDTFEIVSANSVVGAFSSIVGEELANGSYFDVIYLADAVLLAVISGLPGDYNNNGSVDAADFTIWRDQLGGVEALVNDDTPGVGNDDYTRWVTNFGNSLPGSGAFAPVPEAGALSMALLAATMAIFRRWRGAQISARQPAGNPT